MMNDKKYEFKVLNNELCKKYNINKKTANVICEEYNTTQDIAKQIIDMLTLEKPYLSLYGIGLLIVQRECSEEIQKIIKKAGE